MASNMLRLAVCLLIIVAKVCSRRNMTGWMYIKNEEGIFLLYQVSWNNERSSSVPAIGRRVRLEFRSSSVPAICGITVAILLLTAIAMLTIAILALTGLQSISNIYKHMLDLKTLLGWCKTRNTGRRVLITIWRKVNKFIKSHAMKWENACSAAEKQVVQVLRTVNGRQKFNSQAKKHLDLEFREADYGSIIIRFTPKVGKSLQKLKQSCVTGKIQDFLTHIFVRSGVELTLGEGNFSWKLTIYKTSCRPFHPSAQETASPVLRMVNEEEPDAIKDHWNLFVEEIDPWTLLEDLQMKGLVGKEDGDKMLKLDSRKDCVKFLLERLLASEEPDLCYEILLDHCQEHSGYAYQKIQAIEGLRAFYGYVEFSALAGKISETERYQSEREMLFTATVILSIHRKEKKSKQPGSHMELEISHLTIQEPVCYFDIEEAHEEEGDVADLQKEVVMVLEQVL